MSVPEKKNFREKRRRPQDYKRGNNKKNDRVEEFVSIVIPLFNEEESLAELALQIEDVFKKHRNYHYEVIFVDDGSTDNSYSVVKRINNRNGRFKAIRFRRNYGKAAALSAGFKEAKGSIIITMDADLQDDPQEIPALINKIREGYDLVSGWKKNRKDSFVKVFTSKIYNWATSVTSGVKLHDHNCGLKAYRRSVIKTIKIYGEMHRYMPALANWEGYSVTEMVVKHHKRKFGKTKYGLSRFIKGYLDLLTVLFTTRYLKRPLHFFGTFGSLFVISGFAIDLWLSIEWFLGLTSLSNRPLVFLGVALIIVGVQFISMGLIAELITKNNSNSIQYNIKEKL